MKGPRKILRVSWTAKKTFTVVLQVYGLAACAALGRLYISDWDNDSVHAVPLSVDNDPDIDDDDDEEDRATSWDVANQPAGLSLTAAAPPNVLVACHGAGKVQEWSPDGILIRQVGF